MQQDQNIGLSLDGHTSSEENQNNSTSSLIEHQELGNTPFTAVRHEDDYFITWGKYKLSENMESWEECKDHLIMNMWDVISNYTVAIIQAREEWNARQAKSSTSSTDSNN